MDDTRLSMRGGLQTLIAAIAWALSAPVSADNDTLFGNFGPSEAERQAMVDQADAILSETNGRPKGRTRDAYTLLNNAKNAGSAEAYGVMGDLYEGGNGVKPVPFIANDFFWNGAQDQDPESMYRFALHCFDTPGRYREGTMWLKRAADAGHPEASWDQAMREFEACQYEAGQNYLRNALAGGLVKARFLIAESYLTGKNGFEQSLWQAFGVYEDLAREGHGEAMFRIGRMFEHDLLGGNAAANERAAVHWYFQGAQTGYPEAMTAYAHMVERGIGTAQDVEEGIWFRRLARASEAQGRHPQRRLIGVPLDRQHAMTME